MKESEIRQEFSQISKKMQDQAKLLEEESRGRTDDEKRLWLEWGDRRNVLEEMLETKRELERNLAEFSPEEARSRYRREDEGQRADDDNPQSQREGGVIERNASLDFDISLRNWLMEDGEKKRMELRTPTSPSRYEEQANSLRYAQQLAQDGDEVALRFLRMIGHTDSRAQMVGSDVLGGYTVPDSDMGLFDTAMKRYNSIERGGIRMFNTSDGRDIPIVTSDDTDNEGEWLAERQASSEGEIEFSRGELRAHSVGSKRIPISFELLRDSGFDILAYIIDMAYIRIGRSKARAMTGGDGVGKPRGASLDAHLTYNLGSGANVVHTYANWVDFFGTLPAAYADMPVLQISRRTRFDMMKITDNEGRPLWMPSLVPDAPGSVLGDRYEENDFLDNVGGNNRTLALYGDWMRYYGREVQMVEVLRYSDSYLSTRAIAVELISFCDGRLVDAGQHPVVKMGTGTAGFVT